MSKNRKTPKSSKASKPRTQSGPTDAARSRDYKHEYRLQVARGEHPRRMERQRARRAVDAKGIDRTGKDVSHKKALARGGSNSDGYKLESPSKNRARGGAMSKPGTKTGRGKKK